MMFGWLKYYLPRSLYARASLILLFPVVVLQLVVSVLFTTRHFEDVTMQMTTTVIRELRLILDQIPALDSPADVQDFVQRSYAQLDIGVKPVPPDAETLENQRAWFDFSGTVIIRELVEDVPELQSIDLTARRTVRVFVETSVGPLELSFDRRRVSAANPHQLFVNMIFFSIVITTIALIYLRNQVRPIRQLATAANAFGRGRIIEYTPSGATEVREAGAAFLNMRQRIERQLETRTLMLSGVSHDLRTPLTRMRLELSMMDEDVADPLMRDVKDMEHMISEFLNFVKDAGEGTPEEVNVQELVAQTIEDAQRAGQDVMLHDAGDSGAVWLRPAAIRRALDNLISNAVRYGGRAEVSTLLTEKTLRFRVEDPGPGIPVDQRAQAQMPFVRLDPSRNQDHGTGVGLGLAIATDIARAHGGTLRLGSSTRLGGLCADIVISR